MLTRHWKSLLGFVLSGALLWWTLRDVALDHLWQVVRSASLPLLAACTLVATAIVPIRARKWLPILEPVVGPVPLGPLWRGTAIGVMMNNVVPLRAGEFARAFALSREVPRVALTTALGSLAVDRIFDALVVFAMMFAALLDPRFPSNVDIAGRTLGELATGGVGLVIGALVACYVVVLQPQRIVGLVRLIARRFAPRYQDPLVGFVELGVGSLAVLTDTRRFMAVLLWTVLHWGTHALALYLGFLAIGIDAPLSAAFFLQGVLAIGVAVPSSPGFFGVFEVAATVGLSVYGVPKDLAVSWALSYHLLSFIPITVIGAVYFARLGLSVDSVRGAQRAPTSSS
ncbi:MAG: lysylphosphatidylglycerol synthase transmembrane domain-containing protein [Gemmatimonadaceae bacterium]